ncbi:hypothetical protein VTN96DRAFT_7869 [Rasamsonia emersonii]|uniref:Allergen Asp f 15 n=1 Tax=Rasamsonia emersonii (strain ATCC 16479 / CBS 393.64 / IMI 116815) TaxID=1408163 RepID=A0A0F4YLK0_RASE3|nr:Allergen Asp f 15 Precursor [Rasamsonia emersonii CBS 393.64]KKA18488.1 Allergen Asp f 15 Precursor [Rasamsonia emersonii CBS 393.64]
MKFITLSAIASILAAPLAVLAAPASPADSATQVSVSYDTSYDNANLDLSTVACSNGQHGLETKGYKTAGQLPKFPFVGGSPTVAGWDSPNCGSCYALTWENNTIYVTAIDAAPNGFNIALSAMNQLTGGLAQQLGRVTATYTPADPSQCGF